MKIGRSAYLLLGRIISPVAIVGLAIHAAVTGRARVRVVVANEDGEILLVRNVISRDGRWTFPGGGIDRHESPASAARRELHEETGIEEPLSRFRHVRTVARSESVSPYDAEVFYVKASRNSLPETPYNPAEIATVGWFAPGALPERTSTFVPLVLRALKM